MLQSQLLLFFPLGCALGIGCPFECIDPKSQSISMKDRVVKRVGLLILESLETVQIQLTKERREVSVLKILRQNLTDKALLVENSKRLAFFIPPDDIVMLSLYQDLVKLFHKGLLFLIGTLKLVEGLRVSEGRQGLRCQNRCFNEAHFLLI